MSVQGGVRRDVERERRLAHRGARGDEDEVGLLQAARVAVEVAEARADAREPALILVERLDAPDRVDDEAPDGLEGASRLVRGDGEDLLLRVVHDVLDIVGRLVGRARDLCRGVDEVAQLGFLLDDLRVVDDVRGSRHVVGERRNERDAADLLEHFLFAQRLGERHEVDGLVVARELEHRLEDDAVRLAVEIIRAQEFLRLGDGFFFDEHGAEHGLLSLDVLRGDPLR